MRLRLTLTANAGLCVELGGETVWIDALHESKVPGFSTLDRALQERIFDGAIQKPELVLYTHLHPDHYSPMLTRKALERFEGARLILPGETECVSCGQLQVHFLRTVHEGAQFSQVEHFSLVLECGGKRIFISGDCALEEPSLKGADFDLAVLDFPWLTLRRGRDFLQSSKVCKKAVLYHLPFEGDDVNGYRSAAQKAADFWGALLLCQPLQTLEFEL